MSMGTNFNYPSRRTTTTVTNYRADALPPPLSHRWPTVFDRKKENIAIENPHLIVHNGLHCAPILLPVPSETGLAHHSNEMQSSFY